MRIEDIETMISYQRKTIQNAAKISKDFKSGYMSALRTLSASIEAERYLEEEGTPLQRIV